MSRYRVRGILLTLTIAMIPIVARAHSRNNPTYGGVVNFGAQQLHLKDGCLVIDGTLTSGNFFEDLKRRDNDILPEFTKSGTVVTEYPELLTASIRILGNECAASPSDSPSSIFSGESYSLIFEVAWKNGLQLRPAVLSPVVAHCVGSSTLVNPKESILTVPSITCQMTVESKGVPLAHHLIVSVFASDGRRLTRLSAAP